MLNCPAQSCEAAEKAEIACRLGRLINRLVQALRGAIGPSEVIQRSRQISVEQGFFVSTGAAALLSRHLVVLVRHSLGDGLDRIPGLGTKIALTRKDGSPSHLNTSAIVKNLHLLFPPTLTSS